MQKEEIKVERKASSFDVVADIVTKLVADKKGILDLEGIYETWQNYLDHDGRTCCRDWFPDFCKEIFTSKDGEDFLISRYTSGIILPSRHILHNVEIITGIDIEKIIKKMKTVQFGVRLDRGCIEAKWQKETQLVTEGNDDLQERCRYFRKKGYTFAKWRYFSNLPSNSCDNIKNLNCNLFSRFVMMCVSNEIAPILEIIFINEEYADPKKNEKEMHNIFTNILKSLSHYNFRLKTLICYYYIGNDKDNFRNPELVAQTTLTSLQRSIPGKLGGILLAQKMSDDEMYTESVENIIKSITRKPWPMTFIIGKNIHIENKNELGDKKQHFQNPKIASNKLLERLKSIHTAISGSFNVPDTAENTDESEFLKTHDFSLLIS